MSNYIVSVDCLSHRYTKHWAVKDVSFHIDQTGVLGLLGSNGAGKSTTMNILCGVMKATAGRVTIDGIDLNADPRGAKRKLGFLPQTPPLYMDLTVDEYLGYCATLRQVPKDQIRTAMEEAKERCGVAHFSKRLIRNLSGGYRQRVGIAQAIIHRPRLVVLDEPTNGLDPLQIYEVRNLIKEIARERSVIFSSHILSEVQATCQRVIMIEGGRIVFNDSMTAFDNYIVTNRVNVAWRVPPTMQEILDVEGVTAAERLDGHRMLLDVSSAETVTERIVALGIAKGWGLQEIYSERASLDEVFASIAKTGKT